MLLFVQFQAHFCVLCPDLLRAPGESPVTLLLSLMGELCALLSAVLVLCVGKSSSSSSLSSVSIIGIVNEEMR